MITNGTRPSARGRMKAGVAGFMQDTLELCELQGLLLAEDLKKSKTSIILGVICVAVSCVFALAVLTTLLIAAGSGLAAAQDWDPWLGQLVVSGIALGLLVLATLLGVWLLIRSTRPLSRSATELKHNWAAVKAALRPGGPSHDYTLDEYLKSPAAAGHVPTDYPPRYERR